MVVFVEAAQLFVNVFKQKWNMRNQSFFLLEIGDVERDLQAEDMAVLSV